MCLTSKDALESEIAEQATGCSGVGGYREWARGQGYPHLKVWDWTSSAGDWSFLVSKDGVGWVFMYQENNYPRPGFTYFIDDAIAFYGDTEEELFEDVAAYFEGGLR